MTMLSVNIDFGNVWDALSAIGTVGAVIVSLWIALPSRFEFVTVKLEGFSKPMYVNGTKVVNINVFNHSDFVVTVSSVILKQVRKKGILMWLLPRRSLVLSFPFEVEPHQNGQMIYELSNLNYIVENDKFEKEKYYQFVIGTKSGKRIVTKKILGSEIESLIKK